MIAPKLGCRFPAKLKLASQKPGINLLPRYLSTSGGHDDAAQRARINAQAKAADHGKAPPCHGARK